ncbi:ATP-dependent endonuclease [Pengzhenrongella sp.]|uniref:ATP-dependent endonuclease n=1 Tax=Pengzhenrongella sp. TaxID=2888820 RepID=UPI002F922AB6
MDETPGARLPAGARAVVLVEGVSDQAAVEALARRGGRDLDGEGVVVVPMGGATNIGRFLELFGPRGADVTLTGLCDAGEEAYFRRSLERAGFGSPNTRAEMESLGFYVCDADLEDELIRSLGATEVERVIGAQGDLNAFRLLQQQPAQRGRGVEQHLRRFMGSGGGRKIRYASLLVDALDLTRVPTPLALLLEHI